MFQESKIAEIQKRSTEEMFFWKEIYADLLTEYFNFGSGRRIAQNLIWSTRRSGALCSTEFTRQRYCQGEKGCPYTRRKDL